MTLTELADYTCAKVGQTDEGSLAQCKRFLDARLRLIWDSALWRESLCLIQAPVEADTTWLVFPASVERILKLRTGSSGTLPPLEPAAIFDYAPDLFEAAGEPEAFAVFAPVMHGPNADATDGLIITQASSPEAAQDRGRRAYLEVEQADGARVTETLTGDGSSFPVTAMGRFILRFSKEVTAGAYQIGFVDGSPLSAALAGEETSLPRRPRVRLLRTSGSARTALALGKRAYPGFVHDFESPALSNVEPALLAFGLADMLERQRQYAKAQLKLQEAQAEMSALHDLERNQTACESRIVPAVY